MTDLATERDTLQQRLLAAIGRQFPRQELVLKGGAALRFATGSERYTQDLDFDHDPKRQLEGLEKRMQAAVELALRGVSLAAPFQLAPPYKRTNTTVKWKLHVPLASGQTIPFEIQVSRRAVLDPKLLRAVKVTPSDRSLSASLVTVYAIEPLLDQKIRAFLDPKRNAARDVFDLAHLVAAGHTPSVTCLAEIAADRDVLRLVQTKLEGVTWAQFETEVLPTLPDARRSYLDENELEGMRLEILKAFEQWVLMDTQHAD